MYDEDWNGPGDDWYPGGDDDEDAAYERYREEVTRNDLGSIQAGEHGNAGRSQERHPAI